MPKGMEYGTGFSGGSKPKTNKSSGGGSVKTGLSSQSGMGSAAAGESGNDKLTKVKGAKVSKGGKSFEIC